MTRRGFTLIEALVAVTILALAVAGPLVTANRALVANQTSRDQLTASYLAQEGVEYIRTLRDNEYLGKYAAHDPNASANAWTAFLQDVSGCVSSACTVDPVYGGLTQYAGNAPLYLTNCPSGLTSCTPPNVYTQQNFAGSSRTAFTRTVQMGAVTANEERVTSTVSWSFHGLPYSIVVIDHLTSWQ